MPVLELISDVQRIASSGAFEIKAGSESFDEQLMKRLKEKAIFQPKPSSPAHPTIATDTANIGEMRMEAAVEVDGEGGGRGYSEICEYRKGWDWKSDKQASTTTDSQTIFAAGRVKNELSFTQRGVGIEDDSLTSLHWLTGVRVEVSDGRPLQLQCAPPSPAPSVDSICEDVVGSSPESSPGTVDVKPPYSYATLIIMSMKNNDSGKMTLSQIYQWISDNFIYYRKSRPTWHNSIRHNLSLNKCFKKIPRKKGEPGKGGYWALVPEYAEKLLESNIRKRRASSGPCSVNEDRKRKRLKEVECDLLSGLKYELGDSPRKENILTQYNSVSKPDNSNTAHYGALSLPETLGIDSDDLSQLNTLAPNTTPCDLPGTPPHTPGSSTHLDDIKETTNAKSSSCGMELLSDLEHCRRDHAYGKSPVAPYDDSDEENIRAIALQLQGNDRFWNYQEELPSQDIPDDTLGLLQETRNITDLNSCFTDTDDLSATLFYCLRESPMSGDDEGLSNNGGYLSGDMSLLVKGTAMTLCDSSTQQSPTGCAQVL